MNITSKNYIIKIIEIKELRLWNLSSRKTVWSAQAHKGFVKGISWVPFSQNFVTVGEDKTVKLWDRNEEEVNFYFNIYIK